MFQQTDDYIGDINYESDGICRGSDSESGEEPRNSDSDNDFEAQMNRGVDETIRWMTSPHFKSGQSPPGHQSDDAASASSEKRRAVQYYDDMYFSSGSSADEGEDKPPREEQAASAVTPPVQRRRRVQIPSNDDLLYDPRMDDEDEKWVLQQRQKYSQDIQPPPGFEKQDKAETESGSSKQECASESGNKGSQKKSKLNKESVSSIPKSDAILNCPSCMSLLCLDCQRHERYLTQYRAMFVRNCILQEEVLRYKEPKKEEGRPRKRRKAKKEGGEPVEEVFVPVKCSTCNTEVAVYDKDEVYHFFYVIASAP